MQRPHTPRPSIAFVLVAGRAAYHCPSMARRAHPAGPHSRPNWRWPPYVSITAGSPGGRPTMLSRRVCSEPHQVPISSASVAQAEGYRARGRNGPLLGVPFTPKVIQVGRGGGDGRPNHPYHSFTQPSIRPSTGGCGQSIEQSVPPVYSVIQPGPAHLFCVPGQTPLPVGPLPPRATGPRGSEGEMGSRAVSTTEHTHKTNASSLNRIPWDRSHGGGGGELRAHFVASARQATREQRKREELDLGSASLACACAARPAILRT